MTLFEISCADIAWQIGFFYKQPYPNVKAPLHLVALRFHVGFREIHAWGAVYVCSQRLCPIIFVLLRIENVVAP